MSQNNSDYEKKVAKANAARQRQLEKQKEKLASPEYQKSQQEKQQASQLKSQQRAFEKMKTRLDDASYLEEQQKKQYDNQIKVFEKQRIKEQSLEYIKQQVEKAAASKEKSIKKALERKSNISVDIKKTKAIKSKSIKSKGLKGRNPSALEKILANKIGDIGCICCLNKKWYTSDMAEQESTKFVSLHHIEGRTKEWAHAKVLPLCAYHHDTPAPSHAPEELTPIHRGNKKEWITFNGTEDELLKQVYDIIEEERPWLG